MARPLRTEYEGAVYHVTARGNERGKIFFDEADYRKFKDRLAASEEKYESVLHAYVPRASHYHPILETPAYFDRGCEQVGRKRSRYCKKGWVVPAIS